MAVKIHVKFICWKNSFLNVEYVLLQLAVGKNILFTRKFYTNHAWFCNRLELLLPWLFLLKSYLQMLSLLLRKSTRILKRTKNSSGCLGKYLSFLGLGYLICLIFLLIFRSCEGWVILYQLARRIICCNLFLGIVQVMYSNFRIHVKKLIILNVDVQVLTPSKDVFSY